MKWFLAATASSFLLPVVSSPPTWSLLINFGSFPLCQNSQPVSSLCPPTPWKSSVEKRRDVNLHFSSCANKISNTDQTPAGFFGSGDDRRQGSCKRRWGAISDCFLLSAQTSGVETERGEEITDRPGKVDVLLEKEEAGRCKITLVFFSLRIESKALVACAV